MEMDDLIGIEELCRHYSVETTFVCGLRDYDLLEFVYQEQALYLRKSHLSEFEKLLRMHYELDINLEGMDAIVHLLQKIKHLQSELNELRSIVNNNISKEFLE